MGVYNPDAPILLGEQWVGIRDENTLFIPSVNVVEVGHTFTTTAVRNLTEARFYINDWPPGQAAGQSFLAALYPRGREAQTGPIQRVVIPVNTAAVTGATATNGNAVSAVSDPSDQSYIAFSGSSTLERYGAFFPMSLYAQLLMGKRIVGVNLLYSMFGIGASTQTHTVSLNLDSGAVVNYLPMTGPLINDENTQINKIAMGELNPLVGTATAIAEDRYPFRYQELSRWEASAGVGRLQVMVRNTSTIGNGFNLNYLALEILFCEEQRIAYAGRNFGNVGIVSPLPVDTYRLGANFMFWRGVSALDLIPAIPVGEYTITLSSADTGDLVTGIPDAEGNFTLIAKDSQYPPLNALRQYYAIPPHQGVQVNTTITPGETFTKQETMVLPQVTAHTSGGPLPEMHVYGRQSIAQVYGTITATQEILDSAAGASFSYPWVRYYARRFGDTTVPLKLDSASPTVSGSGIGVFLSPAEWDALPEIIDGWKQITLRFPTAPAMGTGMTPTWRWSATGERSGSRWEVLGVTAPAISGMNSIGNAITNSPGVDSLSSATYGAPSSGATVNEGWIPQYAPPVSATTDDQTSDAVLIFSQDMPPVSGFTVTVTSQAVSGIGLDCGVSPCGIPTAIYYNRLAWTAATDTAYDQYNRTSASGWGTSTSGTLWVNQGQPNADHTVSGGVGLHAITSTGNAVRDVLGTFLNAEAQIDISEPAIAAGAVITTGLMFHNVDSANHLQADLVWNTNNTVSVRLSQRVAGSPTTLNEVTVGSYTSVTVAAWWTLKARLVGTLFYAKAWPRGTVEPSTWQVVGNTSALAAAGGIGVRSDGATGNTNLPVTVSYDNFSVVPVAPSWFYEIQRMDTVDTTWQTIMLGSPAVSGFNDYEARVGVVSSYRIREINSYGFYGLWSSTVTATVTDPGLVGDCLSAAHVLIFTTNSRQDGSSNLGYSSVWEDGRVEEGFTFPEAGWEQLQAMYGKDFYTAFRPLERGGDRFSRTVLVQAAAISPETLADFVDLRDMAWDTVPYICIRDEDGNRWFANVSVPAAKVMLNRSIYLATVDIVEITDTPTAVSP